jgi:TRAP transporter TAXI family solute receptor
MKKILSILMRFRVFGYLAACVLIAFGAWDYWSQFIRSTIVIEAGPKGGFFETTAILIQSELKQYGINSTIVRREDTLKIIDDVNDEKSPVEIGFVAQDTGNREYPEVTAVSTIAMEPLFIFCSASLKVKNLQDLKGLRLAVSPPGSGTRAVAELILGVYGVTSQNTTFLPITLGESREAVRNDLVDAAFFLLPPGNKIISELALNPKLRILSLPQADALASNLGFVRHVTIHEGGFDYLNNVPSQDIQLVAIPVTLIIKKDLKPAIVTMITRFVQTHFQNATLVSQPGELLLIHAPSIPVNIHAESVLKNGLPYVYRALPFSFAALIDHFSLYIGFIIVAASIYSSMRFPSPGAIWREVQLKWYVRKIEQVFEKVVNEGKTLDANDRLLLEKVQVLLNKEEARLKKVSKILAELQSRLG